MESNEQIGVRPSEDLQDGKVIHFEDDVSAPGLEQLTAGDWRCCSLQEMAYSTERGGVRLLPATLVIGAPEVGSCSIVDLLDRPNSFRQSG